MNSPGVRTCYLTGRVHFGGSGKGAFMYNVLFIYGFKDIHFPVWISAGDFNDEGRGAART